MQKIFILITCCLWHISAYGQVDLKEVTPSAINKCTGSIAFSIRGLASYSVYLTGEYNGEELYIDNDQLHDQIYDNIFTNLCPGDYELRLVSRFGCEYIFSATVGQICDLEVVFETTPYCGAPSLYQGDGTITAIPINEVGEVTYIWSNGATTPTIEHLPPGNYLVTITDERNCTATSRATLNDYNPLSIDHRIASYCDGTGTIELAVNNGLPPYSYRWSNGAISQNLTHTPAGIYQVTVTSANGCSSEQEIELPTNNGTYLSGISVSIVQATCLGRDNGTIRIEEQGMGLPPYTYTVSDTDGNTIFNANSSGPVEVNDLIGGAAYEILVVNSIGCENTTTFYNTPGDAPFNVSVVADPVCIGEAGDIVAVVNGFGGDYTYHWRDFATGEEIGNGASTLSHVPAGSYVLSVTDGEDCRVEEFVTLEELPELRYTLDVVQGCNRSNGIGSITVNVEQSTHPRSYLWSTGETTAIIRPESVGNYCVTVTDFCNVPVVRCIDGPAAPITIDGYVTNGNTSSRIDITVNGGHGNYTYEWSHGAITEDAAGLSTGTYTVVVKDGIGCEAEASFRVSNCNPAALDITIVNRSSPTVDCTRESAIAINGMSGTFPLKLRVYSENGTVVYSEIFEEAPPRWYEITLPHGNYTITLTDPCGNVIEEEKDSLSYNGQYELENRTYRAFGYNVQLKLRNCDGACGGCKKLKLTVKSRSDIYYTIIWPDETRTTAYTNSEGQWRYNGSRNYFFDEADKPYFVTVRTSLGCEVVIPVNDGNLVNGVGIVSAPTVDDSWENTEFYIKSYLVEGGFVSTDYYDFRATDRCGEGSVIVNNNDAVWDYTPHQKSAPCAGGGILESHIIIDGQISNYQYNIRAGASLFNNTDLPPPLGEFWKTEVPSGFVCQQGSGGYCIFDEKDVFGRGDFTFPESWGKDTYVAVGYCNALTPSDSNPAGDCDGDGVINALDPCDCDPLDLCDTDGDGTGNNCESIVINEEVAPLGNGRVDIVTTITHLQGLSFTCKWYNSSGNLVDTDCSGLYDVPSGTYRLEIMDEEECLEERVIDASGCDSPILVTLQYHEDGGEVQAEIRGGSGDYTLRWVVTDLGSGELIFEKTILGQENTRSSLVLPDPCQKVKVCLTVSDDLNFCPPVTKCINVNPNCFNGLQEIERDPEAEQSHIPEFENNEQRLNSILTQSDPFLVFTTYPNPFEEVINIRTSAEWLRTDWNIQLYDVLGQRVPAEFTQLGEQHVSLRIPENMATGLYTLVILDKEGKVLHTAKLIHQAK